MKIILRRIRNYCYLVLYFFFRVFSIKKDKIFIQNFNGKGYGDNPKYIVEEILRRGLAYDLAWTVKQENIPEDPEKKDRPVIASFPKAIRTVSYKSIRAIYEETTAGIWIDNCRKQPYVRKRKGQFYIQTWHGMIGPKKMEKDVENELDLYYVRQAKHDSELIDLFLSNGEYASRLIKSSFWYTGEILESGSPRTDIHINQPDEIRHKVYKYFKLSSDTKIVLYAPTFRNNFDLTTYNIGYENILASLRERTNKNWVFLIRLHPNISEKAKLFDYNNDILNASYYSDIQELMLASDILITDYSDCMCDFSLMKKPVFLYIKDYDEYRAERDFYYDLLALPFPAAFSTEELIEKMLGFNHAGYIHSLEKFHHRLAIMDDGSASKRVVDRILIESEL